MQVPGPTLIVTKETRSRVTLTNNLPTAAGNTSILFPGFNVTRRAASAGLLTQEAAPAGTVTYTFTAGSPGTRAYYSGTQRRSAGRDGNVRRHHRAAGSVPAQSAPTVKADSPVRTARRRPHWGESDFRLSRAAYDHSKTCYDREYLFQFSEMDPNIHTQALAQVSSL